MSDQAPNPRDFSEYGDYRAALEEWEWQQDQLDDPDGAKQKEAEHRREAWGRFVAEGRAPRCIPSCRKPLCLEREGCIWYELQIIQEVSARQFFGRTLPTDLRFVDPDSMENREKLGLCSVLPALWQKEGSFEHRTLRFFLSVWDLLSLEKNTPAVRAFCRDVYRLTHSVLWKKPWKQHRAGCTRIALFLKNECPAISPMAATMLNAEFTGLQKV